MLPREVLPLSLAPSGSALATSASQASARLSKGEVSSLPRA